MCASPSGRQAPAMVQVVKYVSECDTVPVGEPLPYDDALEVLRAMAPAGRSEYDLVYVETGRLASWCL